MQSIFNVWRKLCCYSDKGNITPTRAAAPLKLKVQRCLLALVVMGFLLWVDREPTLAAPAVCAAIPSANPLLATDTWVSLANGERHWYAFRDEGDSTTIAVRMTVLPEHSAAFWVLTPEQFKRWQQGEAIEAVGAGTEPALFYHDLYWTGSFVQSGIYYVLVESNGQGVSNYKLTIRGDRISFPLQRFPIIGQVPACPTDGSQPAPSPTPNGGEANPSALVVSSPESPLPPVGKLVTIAVGESHWYAFRDEGDEASIQIRADATPDACLTFQVWTPENLQRWQQGQEFRPVGQGTTNATLKADLFWSGSFVKSGIYYVVVKHNPALSNSCTYALTVTGDDVSLVLPPAQ